MDLKVKVSDIVIGGTQDRNLRPLEMIQKVYYGKTTNKIGIVDVRMNNNTRSREES